MVGGPGAHPVAGAITMRGASLPAVPSPGRNSTSEVSCTHGSKLTLQQHDVALAHHAAVVDRTSLPQHDFADGGLAGCWHRHAPAGDPQAFTLHWRSDLHNAREEVDTRVRVPPLASSLLQLVRLVRFRRFRRLHARSRQQVLERCQARQRDRPPRDVGERRCRVRHALAVQRGELAPIFEERSCCQQLVSFHTHQKGVAAWIAACQSCATTRPGRVRGETSAVRVVLAHCLRHLMAATRPPHPAVAICACHPHPRHPHRAPQSSQLETELSGCGGMSPHHRAGSEGEVLVAGGMRGRMSRWAWEETSCSVPNAAVGVVGKIREQETLRCQQRQRRQRPLILFVYPS
jgi:hypothetical protein